MPKTPAGGGAREWTRPRTVPLAYRYPRIVGRFLVLAGIVLVFLGLIVVGADRAGIHLGRLPGDIRIEGKRGGFYFPVVTCILLSVLLSLISWFFSRR